MEPTSYPAPQIAYVPVPYRSPSVERYDRSMKWLLGILAAMGVAALGLVTLLIIGLITGPAGLLAGMFLAMLPLPMWILLVLWLDRYEAEPGWLLASAFVWGAVVAVFFALIFNTINTVLLAAVLGSQAAERWSAALSAPPVEESLKGLALLILYYWKKDEFDGILDGIIYATLVGLGFAMTENFLYYGQALQKGPGEALIVFILRGVISPLSHPLFTSMTGIGLGWARQSDRPAVKFLAPVGGYLAAMFLHFIWNASADLGAAFFAAYLLLMFPTLLAVCVLIFFALKREGKLVREQLERDVRNGLLPEEELELLCTVGGRRRACREASLRGGAAAVRTRRAFHQIASEVAFSRNRIARGVTRRGPSAAELEAAYAQLLLQLQPTWAPPPQERSEFGTGDYRPPER